VNTTVGVAVGVAAPLGEYFSDKLINLGSNRWILRPQVGVLHQRGKWEYEVTGSVFLFGDNDRFWKGENLRKQGALWSIQGHLIRTFKPGLWASFSAGYAIGGQSTINGVRKPDDSRLAVWAISLGVPINPRQGLKFAYISSRTNVRSGSDLDTFQVGWTLMFSK